MCLAVPGKIVAIKSEDDLWPCAIVAVGTIRKQISLALLPFTKVGDFVLVHAGFAIAAVDEQKAIKVLADINLISLPEGDHVANEITSHP